MFNPITSENMNNEEIDVDEDPVKLLFEDFPGENCHRSINLNGGRMGKGAWPISGAGQKPGFKSSPLKFSENKPHQELPVDNTVEEAEEILKIMETANMRSKTRKKQIESLIITISEKFSKLKIENSALKDTNQKIVTVVSAINKVAKTFNKSDKEVTTALNKTVTKSNKS